MSAIWEFSDLTFRGNTVEARRLLAAEDEDARDPRMALNAILYTPPDETGEARIEEEKARHLALLADADGQQRAMLLYNLGCFALFQDDILTARLRFGEAARLRPEHLPSRHNLARAHELMAEFEEAIKELEQALALELGSGLTRINLALTRLAAGDRERGLDELRRLAAAEEDNPGIALHFCRALLGPGKAGFAAGDSAEARALLERHPEWDRYAELQECRAMASYATGFYEQAERLFGELLAADETSVFARMGLIKALAAQKRLGEALPHLERYQEIAPSGRIVDAIARIKGT